MPNGLIFRWWVRYFQALDALGFPSVMLLAFLKLFQMNGKGESKAIGRARESSMGLYREPRRRSESIELARVRRPIRRVSSP